MKNLIGEIHRRSMWQVLGIYAAAAWIVLQIVDTLAGALGLPEWAASLALFLLIIGLPIVLATAFVQGGMRSKPLVENAGTKTVGDEGGEVLAATPEPVTGAASLLTWRNALAGGVVAFALLGLVGTAWVIFGGGSLPSSSLGGSDVNPRSLAVLPFASVEEENESFRVGVHDALLTQLAKVGDLHVISRTSMLEYDGTTKPMRQIGSELGVARILEGSVQRAEDIVQINVQLIDTSTDGHVWAETYTRDLSASNLIAIQGEIVRDIARELETVLAPEEEAQLASVLTGNLEAYDAFLRARDVQQRDTREGRLDAVQLLERVVEIDPSFAVAWAHLAIAHADVYFYGYDRSSDRAQRARSAVDRAFALDPSLPEAHMAMGEYHYRINRDYDAALQELQSAREQMGETSELVGTIASVQKRRGDFEASIDSYRQAAALDPRGLVWGHNEAQSHALLGAFDEAHEAVDRGLNLDPDNAAAWYIKLLIELAASGDVDRAKALVRQATDAGAVTSLSRSWLARLTRDPADALGAMDRYAEIRGTQYGETPRAVLEARLRALGGETERARILFDSARVILEDFVETQPGNQRARLDLPYVYAMLGRRQDALDRAGIALELLPEDAFEKSAWLSDLAETYVLAGEEEQAIDLLRTIMSRPHMPILLNLDSRWDALRDNPDFQELAAQEQAAWDANR